MDLSTVTATYPQLRQKYRGFGSPTIRIYIDGVDIAEKKGILFSDVIINLSIDSASSSCSFNILGEYEFKNTAYSRNNVINILELGARVAVDVGYVVTENVFHGLIMEVEYAMDEGEAPHIHVECLDAKCLLMKRQITELHKDKLITDVVNDIFQEIPFNSYVRDITVEPFGEPHDMITSGNEDNYQFVIRNATEIGYEFYILQGNVFFHPYIKGASKPPIMTLSPEYGLTSFKMCFRGSALYNSVTVIGMDIGKNESVREESKIIPTVKRYASRILEGADKIYRDYNINNSQLAKDRADALMLSAETEFISLSGSCVGIPELGPGRKVHIQGISPEGDKDFYLTSVRHTLNERGFSTSWEARMSV